MAIKRKIPKRGRKPAPLLLLSGNQRVDASLRSWRSLVDAVNDLTDSELLLAIETEKKRVNPRRDILNRLVSRYQMRQRRAQRQELLS